jgi:hypothetical protein
VFLDISPPFSPSTRSGRHAVTGYLRFCGLRRGARQRCGTAWHGRKARFLPRQGLGLRVGRFARDDQRVCRRSAAGHLSNEGRARRRGKPLRRHGPMGFCPAFRPQHGLAHGRPDPPRRIRRGAGLSPHLAASAEVPNGQSAAPAIRRPARREPPGTHRGHGIRSRRHATGAPVRRRSTRRGHRRQGRISQAAPNGQIPYRHGAARLRPASRRLATDFRPDMGRARRACAAGPPDCGDPGRQWRACGFGHRHADRCAGGAAWRRAPVSPAFPAP